MKQQAVLIRPGWVIVHKDKNWSVLKTNTVKPGKGGAFINVEMKELIDGTKTVERYRTDDTIEKVMVETIKCQFLFEDTQFLTFMENENYEQFNLGLDVLGDQRPFLADGMEVGVSFVGGNPASVELPQNVICKIAETEPVVKGQTAASSNKPAILDNGVRVMVPPFVNVDDRIVVNTKEFSYVERAK